MNGTGTMSAIEHVYRAWPIFLAFIGGIAWMLRLEAKVVYLERYVKELNDTMKDRDLAMWKALTDMQKDIRDVLQHLAKIEGKLEGNNSKQ